MIKAYKTDDGELIAEYKNKEGTASQQWKKRTSRYYRVTFVTTTKASIGNPPILRTVATKVEEWEGGKKL
jgi:hypothetical protein